MKVRFKKLVPGAVIPSYAKKGDAGMDLTAIDGRVTDDFHEYKTGLAVEIPEGFVGLIFPRSSISKYDLALANSVGVIDSGYRGEILCRFKLINDMGIYPTIYKFGEKIAQLIIMPIPEIEPEEVDELSDSDRGEGGFGHTGK
jgi:dUTP pyrophosphatase